MEPADETTVPGLRIGTLTIEYFIDEDGEEIYHYTVDGLSHLMVLGLLEQTKFDHMLINDPGGEY